MSIYKNYLKKFAPDSANHAHKSSDLGSDEDTSSASSVIPYAKPQTHGILSVSTQLPQVYLQHVIACILALSACVLLSQIMLSDIVRLISTGLVIILAIYDFLTTYTQRAKLHSLHCYNHAWLLQYSDGSLEGLEIQAISKGLGMMYLLSFVSKDSAQIQRIAVWKFQTNSDFLAYCSQLSRIGSNK